MGLMQIGSSGNMLGQASNMLGSNAITNALGLDFGALPTPNRFLTKFSPVTIFTARSLAYEFRTAKNFDVIFHWHPKRSQIRTMFSQALASTDTNDMNLIIQGVKLPNIVSKGLISLNPSNIHFQSILPGSGINGDGMFSMSILNTEFSYISHCFYQWLCETETPYWIYGSNMYSSDYSYIDSMYKFNTTGKGSYNEPYTVDDIRGFSSDFISKQPINLESVSDTAAFTRADIQVKYYSGNMKELHSVWFMGAFPNSLQMESLDNKNAPDDSLDVIFSYDNVCIETPFAFNNDTENSLNITKSMNKSIAGMTDSIPGLPGAGTSEWAAGLYDDTLTQIGNTYLAKASNKMNRITNSKGDKLSAKVKSTENKLTAQ